MSRQVVPPVRHRLIEASLNLAWSHWVGLGVRGTAHPPSTAVDPEALLYFTACLVDHDPRLKDEVADWWSRHEPHLSRVRLSGLEERFGELVTRKLDTFLETLRGATRTSGKSRLDHLKTPARSLLRMRCVFGANARAEVLLEFLTRRAQSDFGLTALALSEVGYTKRNIALVLDDLASGGLLVAANEGNRVRYRLTDPDGLERVLRPLPSAPGLWHFRLPILAAFVELFDRLQGRDAIVQGIEAKKTFERVLRNIVAAGITESPATSTVETYWPELQRWLVEQVAADDADSERRIGRMLEGEWLSPNQEPQRPERFSSGVLPRLSANPVVDRELICLDLVQARTAEPANDWVWAVLSMAATTTYAHTIGLDKRKPSRFVTWEFGEPRTYSVEYADPLPHERISRLYGAAAAARARADRPAVQLHLKLLGHD